jgi:non-heme chloroperoxidase
MTASVQDSRLAKMAVASALFVAMAQPSFGQDVKHKPIAVKTPDGLSISAQQWGNPAGPEILFIHGFSQSHLSWIRQVDSDLTKEFHIVTYDLRGHGNSDKPLDPARYRDSKAWGDEVQAVIDAAGLKRPVLVGWSYAGRVISDYLATHGSNGIAGINFVDAPIKVDPALIGENLKNLPLMASEDLASDLMSSLKLPVLVTHGAQDREGRYSMQTFRFRRACMSTPTASAG